MTKYPIGLANVYPLGTETMNYCMFCGASAQGFPFSLEDNNRDLFDIIEFHNVELPVVANGVLS